VRHLAIAAALVIPPATCFAEELETTHLFGFTLGSDVNAVGEREAESESTAREGRRLLHRTVAATRGQVHPVSGFLD
jgi:hypothetical protein